MGQLISAGLRKQAAGAHLDAEMLGAFSENALSPAEREHVMAHLANCGDCREVLFLAQPQAGETQISFSPSPRPAALVVRWAALAAGLVIVAGGVFIARHELTRNTETTANQPQAPESVAKTAEDGDVDPLLTGKDISALPLNKRVSGSSGRPALKHMTARPQAKMQFEANDEVRVANSAPAAPPANLPVETRNGLDLRDKGTRASQGAFAYRPDNAKAEQLPRSTSESVEVTAAPVVTVDAGGAVKEDSVAQQQAAPATTGYIGGAAFRKLPPPAQWSLTTAGAAQRSFDQGKTWQPVSVNNSSQKFLAVFSSGARVWLGGMAGALYQSNDSGIIWTRVTPATASQQLTADVVHIEFSDAQNGTVTAADGELWQTADGGQSWTVTKK